MKRRYHHKKETIVTAMRNVDALACDIQLKDFHFSGFSEDFCATGSVSF